MSALLRAYLLGTLTVYRGDELLSLPTSQPARALLAYLLLNRKRSHQRVVLAGIFWPEEPESRARRALTQALWQIRTCLPEILQTEAAQAAISEEARVWVDVEAFMEAALPHLAARSVFPRQEALNDLEQALKLYQGDMLEGFYDDWALDERERLHEIYLQVLERLAQLYKTAGRFSEALDCALRLTNADPLNESGQREVMRIYAALNRPEAALAQFQRYSQILQVELGAQPDPLTTDLASELGSRIPEAGLPYLPATHDSPLERGELSQNLPLIGREQERRELLAGLNTALSGKGVLYLIEGEAGAGKTRLLQEITRDAEWRGAQTLWGRCLEGTNQAPYAPWMEALNSGLTPLRIGQLSQIVAPVWLQTLAETLPILQSHLPALPDLSALDQTQSQERFVNAMVEFISGWTRLAPLVFVLDDLHWAGLDTLYLLETLARRMRQRAVLILGAYRLEEAQTEAQTWHRLAALDQIATRRLALAHLEPSAAGELVRRSLELSEPAPYFESRLYHESAGNPLFILETLRFLYDERLLYRDDHLGWRTPWDESTQDYTELPLPKGVEKVIQRRLSRLPPGLSPTLHLAATLGSRFELELLSACSEGEKTSLFAELNQLKRLSILNETQVGYEFSHDKIRQAAYQAIEAPRRLFLHRRVAEQLEIRNADLVEMLAYHYLHAQVWEKALDYLCIAGDKASQLHASQVALKYYADALAILEEHLLDEGDKHGNLDGLERIQFDLLAKRGPLLWATGEVEQERLELEKMSGLAERLGEPELRIRAYNQRAACLCDALDDYDGAYQTALTALDLSRQEGDLRQQALALETLSSACYYDDQHERAIEYGQQALQIWQTSGEPQARARLLVRLGRIYKKLGRLEQAAEQYTASMEIAEATNDPYGKLYALMNYAILKRVKGEYLDAIELNEKALGLARQIGHRSFEATILDNLGVAYWSLRDYGRAIQSVHQSLDILRATLDRRGMLFCLNNLGDLHREIGAYKKALEYHQEGLSIAVEIGFRAGEAMTRVSQGRLYLDLGECSLAENEFLKSLEISQNVGLPDCQGNALWGLGLVFQARGDLVKAIEALQQALQALEQAGEGDYATIVRSDLAICQLEAGQIDQAYRLSCRALAELETHAGGEELQRLYWQHSQVAAAAGDRNGARQALQKAYDILVSQAQTLPDAEQRASFLDRPAANRQIRQAWEAGKPEVVSVRLPPLNAPAGRALDEQELVVVCWTLETAEDNEIQDPAERRRVRLLRILAEAQAQGAAPTCANLAQALGSGQRTIERDLALIRKSQAIKSTRRGKLAG